MRSLLPASLALFGAGPHALASTLTITPDQTVYQVGDTITLSVSGDAQGASAYGVYGRILFDAGLADYVASHQERLRSRGSSWAPGQLTGGDGFGEAFSQWAGGENETPDGLLAASVTLVATAPGVLDYSWQTDTDVRLWFLVLLTLPVAAC